MSPRSPIFLSRLFQPAISSSSPSDKLRSLSQKLMSECHLTEHSGSGLFTFMPMAYRSLQKLIKLVEVEMDSIGGAQMQMPVLAERRLWEKSGRWNSMGSGLLKITDRNQSELCLQPTHEEMITSLVAENKSALKMRGSFPLLLYQITEKFRDEPNPRFGILRARAFLMKDLYSFDLNDAAAEKSYQLLTDSYWRLLRDRLALPVVRVAADSGAIGGAVSHEFHLENDAGQDFVHYCLDCKTGYNRELMTAGQSDRCQSCSRELICMQTVEVGHTFMLGTKYSSVFGATAPTSKEPLSMGCYGIGVSRLLAACVDICSNGQNIGWPSAVAPFTVVLVLPKRGSKEQRLAGDFVQQVLEQICALPGLEGDVLVDDRTDMTVGRRLVDLKRLGIPFVIVAGKSLDLERIPRFELVHVPKEETIFLTHRELMDYLSELCRP